jgi:four helix bundle protein
MSNENTTKYDLEERTAKFGEAIIGFCKTVPKTIVTVPLVSQLVRSATSIGANYCEADCAESKKDFEHKLGICKKEAKETGHWLRMIMVAVSGIEEETSKLQQEAFELNLIFISIIKKSRANSLEIRH